MPLLSILVAAAQVDQYIDAAILDERYACGRESGIHAEVEAAVAVEIDGIVAVEFHAFLVGEEHRHARSVLAGEEDLLALEAVQVEVHLRCCVECALVLSHVIAIDGSGNGKG